MEELIKNVIAQEAEAIKNIPVSSGFSRAVEIIYTRVHRQKGKLVVSGMGKAGQIAQNIATTFSSTGTPAERASVTNVALSACQSRTLAAR